MCDCRKAINEQMSQKNAKVAEGLVFSKNRVDLAPPMILLEKVDKARRTRLPNLLATYCPFCGEKYEQGTKAEVLRHPTDPYYVALDAWKKNGGIRPAKRPDGIPTRCDAQWKTPAELAIDKAMEAVEAAGGSKALTDAVTLLSQARDRVADHVEGQHDRHKM